MPDDPRSSVVKLFTVIKEPDPFQPWDFRYQRNIGGAGCIIEGNRILTSAHVVRNEVFVQASRPGVPEKFTARVLHVDHSSEVALLTVDDRRFFEGTHPLTFGPLPAPQAQITAFGFPSGGDEVAATRGVVARAEVQRYTHAARRLLAIQTDMPIRAGTSGGPVFNTEGLAVGLAFQSTDDTGYIVPASLIQRFLDDVADGIEGVPDLGIYWEKLENESLRRWAGLQVGDTGILVSRVLVGSSAYHQLREDDVLTKIGGAPIANDGSVALGQYRVEYSHVVSSMQVGDVLEVEVIRNGIRDRHSMILRAPAAVVPPASCKRPTYFVFAGLVFMPLTHEFVMVMKPEKITTRFRYYFNGHGLPAPTRKQLVFINQVLPHDINVGYHGVRSAIVDKVNGSPITEMRDLVEAFKKPIDGVHIIEIDHHGIPGEHTEFCGTRIVLDAQRAPTAGQEIVVKYALPSDRSLDLVDP